MSIGMTRWLACAMVLGSASILLASPAVTGPVELRIDNLKTPLGIDDPAPRFSWQLQDPARGAKQTAYEVLVASSEELLRQGKADVWDSGRIDSSESLNVRYKGPAIAASTRSFWRVRVWNATGKPYPESEIGWWETGLRNAGGLARPVDWLRDAGRGCGAPRSGSLDRQPGRNASRSGQSVRAENRLQAIHNFG